jgi:hypothetical protein
MAGPTHEELEQITIGALAVHDSMGAALGEPAA